MTYRTCAVSVLLALGLAASPLAARAQYPDHPIRIVLPYAPGAAGDVAMRQIQPLLEKRLGQPLIVDYKTGAGGNIGALEVARAKPDGYTLVLGATNNFVINQFLYRKLGFDPLADLEPVGKLADVPAFVYVSAQVPAQDYAQFAQYARAQAGKLNYGSPGMGTTPHLSGYRLSHAMGAGMTHIAYRGSSPGVQALLANEIQMYIGGYSIAAAYVPQGKVRALAVAASERFAGLPDVPTAGELGYPGNDASAWFGLVAPAGTQAAVVDQMNRGVNQALAQPELQRKLTSIGAVAMPGNAQVFAAFVQAERDRWLPVARDLGLKAQ
jgi:tripartite-type tricarboxylate transporter receptor subunit TctC